MAHDIVIRVGQLVDGSGTEPYAGDLAIDGDQITAVGEVSGRGKQEIDAEGHMVTPGFVDLHKHLDAQFGWDPDLTPVSWHGVTTALMGNCGVTFAPCKPADKELLAGMMETVEDIPREAILNGLPWNWEGYGGYLDALDALKPGINVAGMVGHCAVRFYVMGSGPSKSRPLPKRSNRSRTWSRNPLTMARLASRRTASFPTYCPMDGPSRALSRKRKNSSKSPKP